MPLPFQDSVCLHWNPLEPSWAWLTDTGTPSGSVCVCVSDQCSKIHKQRTVLSSQQIESSCSVCFLTGMLALCTVSFFAFAGYTTAKLTKVHKVYACTRVSILGMRLNSFLPPSVPLSLPPSFCPSLHPSPPLPSPPLPSPPISLSFLTAFSDRCSTLWWQPALASRASNSEMICSQYPPLLHDSALMRPLWWADALNC